MKFGNVLLEHENDDIRYGEFDLNSVDPNELDDNDAEFIERLIVLEGYKDSVIKDLQEKGVSSSQFAENLTREWRKKTKKVRQKSASESKIPEYKLNDTNFWILNSEECSILTSVIDNKNALFSELLEFVELAKDKGGIEIQFLD